MLTLKRAQAGFTLIEVVAAAALLGLMVTMAMPSLQASNARVKDSKLRADLSTVDQAIQLYVIDNSKLPENLSALSKEYITRVDNIKDAKNNNIIYEKKDNGYDLSGQDSANNPVFSNGSISAPAETKSETKSESTTGEAS